MSHRYPLQADAPSKFDVRWPAPLTPVGTLPAQVNLLDAFGPPKNQGQEGSCSAQSGSEILAALWYQRLSLHVDFSAAALYEIERYLQGDPTQDTGARLRVTQDALQLFGGVPERDDPYTPADFLVPITDALRAEAARYRIRAGYWTPSLPEILNALAAGHPVQIGIVVHESFESPEVARTGIVPVPTADDPAMGGHALAVYGYDRHQEVLRVRNSWSSAWGDNGDCIIPFAYLANPSDFLSARVYVL